ncbi:DVL19-RELATED-RELATED [Salix purpurea]|uniref:DVL19-RELATED-RELATED n=1 Tax=Salix purpurea TaxID=77065 RepID=A0A9Q0Z1H4_SALPP|nr:DVL19-RELATED-RELATED [Salix purpurea]
MATTLTHSASAPPQFYFDEKWKLSKKEGSSRSRSSTSSLMKNSSHRRCSFTRKCARLVKEQRARFYIMRSFISLSFNDGFLGFAGSENTIFKAFCWHPKRRRKGKIHEKPFPTHFSGIQEEEEGRDKSLEIDMTDRSFTHNSN